MAIGASSDSSLATACTPSICVAMAKQRKAGFWAISARPDGWDVCLSDLAMLHLRIEADFPGTPIVFFGHSMGPLLGQQFIADHGDRLAGVGAFRLEWARRRRSPGSLLIARFERLRLGGHGKSAILQVMLCSALSTKSSRPIAPIPTGCRATKKEVDKYVADPLCGFPFTVQLAIDLVDALGGLMVENLARIEKKICR